MKLGYYKEPISVYGITDNLPFSHWSIVGPIDFGDGRKRPPDYHTFGCCFARMLDPRIYEFKKEKIHPNDEFQIDGDESLLYFSFGGYVLSHEIEQRISSDMSLPLPKIIHMMTKESGFKDLNARAKRHIVTFFGEYSPNGWGVVLDSGGRDCNFNEGHMNDPMLAIARWFTIKGGFTGNNQVRGLDYHMDHRGFQDLLLKMGLARLTPEGYLVRLV